MEKNSKTTKKYTERSIPNKITPLSVIVIVNYINNLIHHAKIYLTLLVPKKFRAIISIIKYTC